MSLFVCASISTILILISIIGNVMYEKAMWNKHNNNYERINAIVDNVTSYPYTCCVHSECNACNEGLSFPICTDLPVENQTCRAAFGGCCQNANCSTARARRIGSSRSGTRGSSRSGSSQQSSFTGSRSLPRGITLKSGIPVTASGRRIGFNTDQNRYQPMSLQITSLNLATMYFLFTNRDLYTDGVLNTADPTAMSSVASENYDCSCETRAVACRSKCGQCYDIDIVLQILGSDTPQTIPINCNNPLKASKCQNESKTEYVEGKTYEGYYLAGNPINETWTMGNPPEYQRNPSIIVWIVLNVFFTMVCIGMWTGLYFICKAKTGGADLPHHQIPHQEEKITVSHYNPPPQNRIVTQAGLANLVARGCHADTLL